MKVVFLRLDTFVSRCGMRYSMSISSLAPTNQSCYEVVTDTSGI